MDSWKDVIFSGIIAVALTIAVCVITTTGASCSQKHNNNKYELQRTAVEHGMRVHRNGGSSVLIEKIPASDD